MIQIIKIILTVSSKHGFSCTYTKYKEEEEEKSVERVV